MCKKVRQAYCDRAMQCTGKFRGRWVVSDAIVKARGAKPKEKEKGKKERKKKEENKNKC